MIELANLQLGQKALEQKHKAPASSREPASASKSTESQHRVSVPKRQRQKATKILRAVSEETEKRSSYYGNRTERMSDEEFAKLQGQAERAFKRASDGSQASGHAYKLDGQAYGAPETSNFAILLADFCGEHNIQRRHRCSGSFPSTSHSPQALSAGHFLFVEPPSSSRPQSTQVHATAARLCVICLHGIGLQFRAVRLATL